MDLILEARLTEQQPASHAWKHFLTSGENNHIPEGLGTMERKINRFYLKRSWLKDPFPLIKTQGCASGDCGG